MLSATRDGNLMDIDLCPRGEVQTMSHLVDSCPLKLHGGLSQFTLLMRVRLMSTGLRNACNNNNPMKSKINESRYFRLQLVRQRCHILRRFLSLREPGSWHAASTVHL